MSEPVTLSAANEPVVTPAITSRTARTHARRLFDFADGAAGTDLDAHVLITAADNAQTRTKLHIVVHDASRRALLADLARDVDCDIVTYADARDLIAFASPDGLVLAADAPGPECVIALMQAVAAASLWWPVIALADEPDVERVVAVIKAGAIDYLAAPDQSASLQRAISRVLPEVKAGRAAHARTIDARQRIGLLTRRERDVLDLLVRGTSNKQMGRDLGISPRTVEIHRMRMLDKLDAGNAQQAIMLHILAFGLPDFLR